MKIIVLLIALCFCALAAAQSVAKRAELTKTVAAVATPETISATSITFRKATVLGKKAARTVNATSVYIGWQSGNDTQSFELVSGGEAEITAPAGQVFNLNSIYVDVTTAGDGVVVLYE